MATPTSYGTSYSDLIKAARYQIAAAKGAGPTYTTDKFWSDDELFGHAKKGTTDLWKAVIDLHHEHFLTLNEDGVSLASGANQLSGVPIDTFRVYLIESTDSATNGCLFVPKPINSREFIAARAQGQQAPVTATAGYVIYYCLTGAGAPNSAPVIVTAPALSSAIAAGSLNFWYVPILGVHQYTIETATNPIPGESDQAIIAWIIAYARGKEREDRSPDPAWLSVYATEKSNLLTSLTPRQEQEAEYVESVFDY